MPWLNQLDAGAFLQIMTAKVRFFDKKRRKYEDYFWNAKRLQSGYITLQRQNNFGELPKLVKGTHC